MRRPRNLSAEERALWDMVARRAKPLDPSPRNLATSSSDAPIAKPQARRRPDLDPVKPFQIGQKTDPARPHDLMSPLHDRLTKAPVQMDSRAYTRMTRGKLDPEGRIDLHGMVLSEAHPALVSFILMAHAGGKRLVLVITGKGKPRDDGGPIPVRQGVLRHQVPQWLALPPLSHVVMQVVPAHLKHGGHGAYYVYLRRSR